MWKHTFAVACAAALLAGAAPTSMTKADVLLVPLEDSFIEGDETQIAQKVNATAVGTPAVAEPEVRSGAPTPPPDPPEAVSREADIPGGGPDDVGGDGDGGDDGGDGGDGDGGDGGDGGAAG